MAKKKLNDKEVAEAIAFVKTVRKQAPPENQIVTGFLDDWEHRLLEELFDSVIRKFKKPKKE